MSTRKSSFFYGTLIALASLVVGMVIASRLDLAPRSLANTANVPAINSAPLTGAIDATTFRTIAHDQSPAVGSIIVTGKRNVPDMSDFFGLQNPFGRRGGRGGGSGGSQQQQIVQGAGSGFIIDKSGYILTNNHVVEDADEITVMLADMKNPDDGLKAKVVGRDKLTDSALIQLIEMPKQPLPEVKFGDSTQIAAGDWVMAIGNPFQFSNTVTVGVVSAVGRVSPELNPSSGRDLEYVQTDAAINRGNSGGPLLNIRGEVVGINTAIISDNGQGGNIGIGFAVPINTIRDVLPQLRSGKVVRGRIGVSVIKTPMTLDEAKDFGLSSPTGAVLDTVDESGPAKAAGLKAGDVIVEFNGKTVKDSADLVSIVTRTTPGTSVPVKVMRAGKPVSLTVRVDELNLDAEQTAQAGGRTRPSSPEQPQDTSFGMTVEPLSSSLSRQAGVPGGKGGALVSDLSPLSPAARGGILPGDIILSVNDKEVSSVSDVTKALDAVPTGRTARVLVWRPNRNGGSGSEHMALLRKR